MDQMCDPPGSAHSTVPPIWPIASQVGTPTAEGIFWSGGSDRKQFHHGGVTPIPGWFLMIVTEHPINVDE